MRRVLALLAVFVPSALPCAAEPYYHHDIDARECCVVIAHAGGGIDGVAYTNSEEAVLHHLAAGARVFEIDFARTRDGVWVGTHDWPFWKRQTGFEGRLPPTYAEFAATRLRPYTAITIPFLERIVARHPDVVIVTDTKYRLEGMASALKETKLFPRLYPQAYAPSDVALLGSLGYRKVILTVYKMNLRQPETWLGDIAATADRLHALTVPLDFFAKHPERLTALGLPIYVHGAPQHINSRKLHRRLRQQGVAGFYLDW
jgi:glycerophosphoryl diester phosphodiesterase